MKLHLGAGHSPSIRKRSGELQGRLRLRVLSDATIKSGLNVISVFEYVSIANLLEIRATNHAFFGKPASESQRTDGSRSSTQV